MAEHALSRQYVVEFLNMLYNPPVSVPNNFEHYIIACDVDSLSSAQEAMNTRQHTTLLASPTKPDWWDGGYVSFDGDLGRDGDQVFLNGELMLETIGYSTLPYLQIVGPTYVVVENGNDQETFARDYNRFAAEGVLPDYLTTPGIIIETGNVFGKRGNRQFIRGGKSSSVPFTPQSILALADENLSMRGFLLAIMLFHTSGSQADLVFSPTSPQAEDAHLLFSYDAAMGRGNAFNLRSGKMYQLSADAFAVLDAFRRDEQTIQRIAAQHSMSPIAMKRARATVLERIQSYE